MTVLRKSLTCLFAFAMLFLLIQAIPLSAKPPAPPAPSAPPQRFIDNKDGTVTDTASKLMWAANDNGQDVTWAAAKAYCESFNGGGHSGWRMPAMAEVIALYWNVDKTSIKSIEENRTIWSSNLSNNYRDAYAVSTSHSTGYPMDFVGNRALPVRNTN
ncbi:MAG: DUF1566 domain-containing protein [Terrimicrobiaceae bacterium]